MPFETGSWLRTLVAVMPFETGSWWVGVHPTQWVEQLTVENVNEVGKFGHQGKIILKWMNVDHTEVVENKFVRHKEKTCYNISNRSVINELHFPLSKYYFRIPILNIRFV